MIFKMPSLLTLPYELLEQIASWCSEADACNLRLVSSQLAHAAASTVFQCFNLCCFESTVRKLRSILQSRLARHVKHIIVHTVILPHLDITLEEFENRLSLLFGDSYDRFSVKQYLPSRDRWPEVRLTLLDACHQNSWFFSQRGQHSLQLSIAKLPSLQKISVDEYCRYGKTHSWHPQKLRPLLSSLICKSLNLDTASAEHSSLAYTLTAIGRDTAHGTATPVRDPHNDRNDAEALDRASATWSQSADEFDRPNALERIKIFEHTSYTEFVEDGHHLDFLLSCNQLQELYIQCSNQPSLRAQLPDCFRPLSTALKPGSPTSHLSRLKIVNAHLLREDFCLFITSHAHTLTSLTITSSWSDDWRGFFRCIARSLRLQDIELHYLQDPSCINLEYDLNKVFFKYGLKSESDERTWLLGERSKEPVLEPEWCDDFGLGSCLDNEDYGSEYEE